jgi:ribosomal protein S18 acetylase RimI-like enzyme
MSFAIRAATLRDVPAILDVTRAGDGEPEWTVEEIVETLTAPGNESWLALDGDEVVGWAYVHNQDRENVEVYGGAYAQLLDLAIARVAERAREAGDPEVTLRAGVIATEVTYVKALEAAGFAFVRRHARMRKALDGSDKPVSGIRPVCEDELPRFHEVLRAAFDETPDYAHWRAAITSWDEWFVAEVGGEIVGVLQSSDQAVANGEGWVKNLAVLREHRKRGLGRGLLTTAFAHYAAKGRTWAGLGVDLTNGAHRLYASLGMAPTFEADVYERTVRSG